MKVYVIKHDNEVVSKVFTNFNNALKEMNIKDRNKEYRKMIDSNGIVHFDTGHGVSVVIICCEVIKITGRGLKSTHGTT